MISTSLDGTFTLSDQMGSLFPLMWLSSQPTWWFGTQGVTTLEFTCVEPTSRRPENLSPLLLSCTYLVRDKLRDRNPLLSVNIKCNFSLCVTIFEKDHSSRNVGINDIVLSFYWLYVYSIDYASIEWHSLPSEDVLFVLENNFIFRQS